MKFATLGLIALLCLNGCAAGGSNVKKAMSLTAPDVVQYPKKTQIEAANELEKCGIGCRVVTEMMADYAVMRDQARILAGKTWLK